MSPPENLSTSGHADFIFEVVPDPDVFDTVRRSVCGQLETNYRHLVGGGDGIREHIRVDVVDIRSSSWVVEGILDGGHDVNFDVTIEPDTDATDKVLSYLRKTIDKRYGPHVVAGAVVFEKVGMRPNAWFVDAKIPPSTDGTFTAGY